MPLLDLDSAASCRDLGKGELLFRSGDSAAALYVVERGGIRLERPLADGFLLTVHTARPGQIFAEAALFAEHYHCDAVAETASRVAVHPKDRVLAALKDDGEFALACTRLLAARL